MDFHSIILKNVKYNIRNYTAFLLGNTLIQCILFMFFTLIFSTEFMDANAKIIKTGDLKALVGIMTVFSAVFILFATVSFTKYRGKEFGVYFTIGLTSKEILKALCFEDFVISLASFVFAAISGTVFSKLFHMAIGYILNTDIIKLSITIEPFLLIGLISLGIFIVTLLYQVIYLKRYSVVNILKSKHNKDIGKSSFIAGIIGIVLLIVALNLFNEFINQETEDFVKTLIESVVALGISIYLLIGYAMTVVTKILKRFKGLYNKQILFVNSLSHRFIYYRTILYIVTLMVIGAISFISLAYSGYESTEMNTNKNYPYDISFIVEKDNLNEDKMKEVTENTCGKIKSFNVLEGLNIPELFVIDDVYSGYRKHMFAISYENYKSITKEDISLADNEVMFINPDKMGSKVDEGLILPLIDNPIEEKISVEEVEKDNSKGIYVTKENKKVLVESGLNNFRNESYDTVSPYIINDKYYNMMKEKLSQDKVIYDVLINLENPEGYGDIREVIKNEFGEKVAETVTINKEEFQIDIKENAFSLFEFSFMGMMFFVGSAAVLYFKTMTSVEEDRERSKLLINIGLTKKEVGKLLSKEIGAIFIVPPIIAIFITAYILKSIFDMLNTGECMWQSSLKVFLVYSIIQIIFYLLTNRRYKKIVG